MTLGSGCGSKTLIRVGAGNLKSLIVYIFLGIAAYMTLRGLFGAFRVGVLEMAAIDLPRRDQDLPVARGRDGRRARRIGWRCRSIVAGGAARLRLSRAAQFRTSFDHIAGRRGHRAGGRGRLVRERASSATSPRIPNTLQEHFVATNSGRMESLLLRRADGLHARAT